MLTKDQIEAAQALFNSRPPVIPGTRVVIKQSERNRWYQRITDAMAALGVHDADAVREFCDLAGLPD